MNFIEAIKLQLNFLLNYKTESSTKTTPILVSLLGFHENFVF